MLLTILLYVAGGAVIFVVGVLALIFFTTKVGIHGGELPVRPVDRDEGMK